MNITSHPFILLLWLQVVLESPSHLRSWCTTANGQQLNVLFREPENPQNPTRTQHAHFTQTDAKDLQCYPLAHRVCVRLKKKQLED